MGRSNDCVLEHLIGSAQRIDVPRSCALVIQAITLVCKVTPAGNAAESRDWQGFPVII
jgi:hypothetical protein